MLESICCPRKRQTFPRSYIVANADFSSTFGVRRSFDSPATVIRSAALGQAK